jgi:hypothetical protein
MDFLFGQIGFLVALGLVFLLPGYSLVTFFERKRPILSSFERLAAGSALSLVSVGFLIIGMDRFGIPLTSLSVASGIAIFSLAFLIPARTTRESGASEQPVHTIPRSFLIVFFGLLIIKSFYFVPTLIPNSTDLGHHLYWIEKISTDHELPVYEERDILTHEDGMHSISDPLPISDFIIGEHLTLSAVRMISDRDFTTSFSVLSLFLVHILTLLAVFSLGRRLFDHLPNRDSVAVWTFLLFGLLYAIGPPQMKYIEGGVIGNTFGNLLIPAILLILVVALREKRADWFAVSVFLVFGLAYTHHLSMLLFATILAGIGILYVALERTQATKTLISFLRDKRLILTILGCLLFIGLVYVPSYLRNAAVETVVGAPDAAKAEHQGLPLAKLLQITGEPRVALALIGLLFVSFLPTFRRKDVVAVLVGWTAPLLLLTLAPEIARLDLPSGRVANYLEMPVAITAGFALATLITLLHQRVRAPRWIGAGILFLLAVTVFYTGTTDNNAYLRDETDRNTRSLALFDTGRYLRDRIPETANIVHDHINIPGNSLLKVFLLRDYNFPFYRAHLFRYDRADREERCTLHLISTPGSEEATQCANELSIRAFVVSDPDDSPQFVRARLYDRVYADPFHAIFFRNTERYAQ